MSSPRLSFLWLALLALGCGSGNASRPASDYPPPSPETSDGEIVGADRQPPGDKLLTGPTIGPGGVSPPAGSSAPADKKPPR